MISNEYNMNAFDDLSSTDVVKLYLTQIAKWIENVTGIPQQIINTHERADINYIDYNIENLDINMTIIADANINIKSISWSDNYGIGLNVDSDSDENGEKVHVILWTDDETQKDEHGYYMDAVGALNGVLVINNPDLKITKETIKEMLAIQNDRDVAEKQEIYEILFYNAKLYEETSYKEFASAWLSFPTTKEAVQAMLQEIGVDGKNYNRYQIDGVESEFKSLIDCIPENADIDELNYLAAKIQNMDDHEIEILESVIEKNERNMTVTDIINNIDNIGCYYLQPAITENEYGEFLLEVALDEIGMIANEHITDTEAYSKLMSRLDEIEKFVDTETFGGRYAHLEKGCFTDYGYLTLNGEITKDYTGKEDIPQEYRVFAYPDEEHNAGLYKIENTDLSDFIYKLHILAGDYTGDVQNNMRMLSDGIGKDYIIVMDDKNIKIADAETVYQDHTDINSIFGKILPSTREYMLHIDKREDGRVFGSVVMVRSGELSEDIAKNRISFTDVTVDIKNGTSNYLTRTQWNNLKHIEHDKIKGYQYYFDPNDVQKLANHLEEFLNQRLKDAETISSDILFDYLNAEYMAEANNSKPAMIRVPLDTAIKMILNEDAAVYRLKPQSIEQISIIAAAKGNLTYTNFREFAVKKDDHVGIDKMCRRETDKLASTIPELDNSKKRNKQEQNL